MTARFIVADVFDGLATLDDGSVDLCVTSPPFLALRSYLPADHPDKGKEIGSEATPAAFLDVMLAVTAELRRVLAPHGSIAVELGDTYAGSGGGGGDYYDEGLRAGQPGFTGSAHASRDALREANAAHWRQKNQDKDAWPLGKSKTLIPELYRIALAYGINPLTGAESPAGRWRIRNVVTWARPNPPVGALGDKWRPATSDVVVACVSDKRYWDDIATRREFARDYDGKKRGAAKFSGKHDGSGYDPAQMGAELQMTQAGAPLLDYWEIPPGGYGGAHYAVFPSALVEPLIKAMAPPKVCRVCGEPSRRIVSKLSEERAAIAAVIEEARTGMGLSRRDLVPLFIGHYKNEDSVLAQISNWERAKNVPVPKDWQLLKDRLGLNGDFDELVEAEARWNDAEYEHVSDHPSGTTQDATGRIYNRLPARKNRIEPEVVYSDCSHDDWRPALILDPFAGSGTTLSVATGHGHDAIGIDLDPRNADLARERIGPFLFDDSAVPPKEKT